MKIIHSGVTIRDIDCEGVDSIEVGQVDGMKRAFIHLDTGQKLAGFHNRQEIDNLIEALQAARDALAD
jgi:hypothetical protein